MYTVQKYCARKFNITGYNFFPAHGGALGIIIRHTDLAK